MLITPKIKEELQAGNEELLAMVHELSEIGKCLHENAQGVQAPTGNASQISSGALQKGLEEMSQQESKAWLVIHEAVSGIFGRSWYSAESCINFNS